MNAGASGAVPNEETNADTDARAGADTHKDSGAERRTADTPGPDGAVGARGAAAVGGAGGASGAMRGEGADRATTNPTSVPAVPEPVPVPVPDSSQVSGKAATGPSLLGSIALYTVLRLALVIVLTAVLMLFMPLIVALMFAIVVQLPLSWLLFSGPRRRVNEAIALASAQRRAERARLQAALTGEDVIG